MKILIVEDEAKTGDYLKQGLSEAGFTADLVRNGVDGMHEGLAGEHDLLILDVMMEQPDDGIVMARDLRRDGFKKPILMLTSISRVTGMTFGSDSDLVPVDAFQEKPLPPKKLLETVAELLKKEK